MRRLINRIRPRFFKTSNSFWEEPRTALTTGAAGTTVNGPESAHVIHTRAWTEQRFVLKSTNVATANGLHRICERFEGGIYDYLGILR